MNKASMQCKKREANQVLHLGSFARQNQEVAGDS